MSTRFQLHPAIPRHNSNLRSTTYLAVLCLLAGLPQIGLGSPITLAQVPAGNGGREPAPNIIVSVDDSGSMGTSGMASLRAALTNAFSAANIPDDSVRLGFQAMWRCRGLKAAGQSYKDYGSACPDNRVQKFSGAHRTAFNNWVNSLQPWNTTPSHAMNYIAGEYMKTTGTWNPYAYNPGVQETPLLSCRKAFHIFMTDGEWNSETEQVNNISVQGLSGNADGSTRTLPDGVSFDPYNLSSTNEPYTRIYRDGYGSATINTLADYAFNYWATDLQPSIPNEVRPIIRQAGPVDYGVPGTPYTVPEYWNPKNDPANWQHLVSYTIGFNNAANLPATRTNRNGVSVNGVSTDIALPAWGGHSWSGDFPALIRGDLSGTRPITWGSPFSDSGLARRQELWHMATNGRGRFVPATNATELANAFAEIVNQIIQDTSTPIASIAANTQAITSGTRVYLAGYDATKWKGRLEARPLTATNSVSNTVDWEASARLDTLTPSTRLIYTHDGTTGTSFEWANLAADQKTILRDNDTLTVTIGQERVDYLRGDRTKEASAGGAYRNRDGRLGDIVNSNIWTTGKPNIGYTFGSYSTFRSNQSSRPTMVYVGANDGMLHGFDASTGNERFAYIPKGVYANLPALTQPNYTHRYFVDGHPFTGDFTASGTTWRTALAGSLAGGGKGYFVLDVTNPGALSTTDAATTVMIDTTDGTDADIGHIYAEPTLDASNSERAVNISKLNNGRWALILGNGVNSTSEKAVLLIQHLDGDKSLLKIELDGTGSNGNGLSNPQLIDIDGDGKIDVAYAGDMLGNLWKIDLSSTSASAWRSYFPLNSGTAVPMFTARDTSNARQPISTAPQWATHPEGGLMIAFATGREMTVADRNTNTPQTLYALRDTTVFAPHASPKMTGGTVISGRSDLIAQTLDSTLTINGQQYGKTSNNAVVYTGAGAKRGWYLDFPALGERAVFNGGKISDRLVYVRSRVPAVGNQNSSNEESCEPNATAADEYMTVVDILSGKPSVKPVFDTDGGGFTGTEATGVSRWRYGRQDRLLIKTSKPGEFLSISPKPKNPNDPNDPDPTTGISSNLRLIDVGWRQLQ